MRVKPLFAPRHGPEMEIMKQMLKAKAAIDFAMFTFAQSSGIDDTMIRLRPLVQPHPRRARPRPGRRRSGRPRPTQGAATWSCSRTSAGTGVRKVHHKLMVIDERLLIVGSFNYTAPANTLNDENIIVIGDLEEDDAAAEAAQRELAAYALAEIDRIINDLSEPV